jgi:ABC-2 type transport system ATP-binding protein
LPTDEWGIARCALGYQRSFAGTGGDNAVEVQGLRKEYGEVVALAGVDLVVDQGTIFGLVGPNGAGKTTLIKSLVGTLRPTAGSAKVLGLDPLEDKWELRRQIGYMPQATALYEDLSARANIRYFSQAQPVENLADKVTQILEFTELLGRAGDSVATFSGGMKKRISLACALVHEPRIIFLDEPTAAVDPHLRFRMWQLFREMASRGTTLVISTHLMEEAMLCDRVAILRRGVLLADDKPTEILKAGQTRLVVHRPEAVSEQTIDTTPEALAAGLQTFGLPEDVEAIQVQPDTLEDVIVALIQSQGES